jgi:aerobic carbon-monoxide dehydrogenase large subunit
MTAPVEVETGTLIGTPVGRKEDGKLLQGQAQWVDNMYQPGTVFLGVVRSPYAHARIKSVNVDPALAHADVVAAWSGSDIEDEWAGSLPCAWIPTEDTNAPGHKPIAVDKVRYVGDAVAVIAATSRAAAEDAMELVEVEYEELPVVVDVEAALAEGAPLVHEEFGTNRCYTWTLEAGEVDRLFSEAAVTVSERYRQNRLIPNAIEPRAVFVTPIPATGEFTLWSTTQVPHIARVTLSGVTGIPETKLRVIAPDVGGGFGSKLNVYAEEALALAVARRLGRAVKWTETRSEGYVSTIHGRDQVQQIELAATAEGKITAVRTKLIAGMGAYLQLVTPGIPLLGAWLYAGCYDVEGYSFECTGVFTNTVPTDAYRGAGRPEATYAIERAVDALARKLDKDPVEVRRLNFIREFPATIAAGLTIDSGDYDACLDLALEKSDYDAVRVDQQSRRAAGDSKRLGIGLSTYVEMCGLAPSAILGAIRYSAGGWEAATIRCLPAGNVQVLSGATPHGQGHETSWSQIVSDRLGYEMDEVEVLHGDTAVVPLGMDTYGSRSLAVGGVALYHAAERIVEKAKKIAAHLMGVDESAVDHVRGVFHGPDSSLTLKEIAFAAWTAHNLPEGLEPGLEATFVYDPPNFSWPSGAHVAIVEVDTETGAVELLRYIAVDDVGTVINPTIVEGQIHGGLAQGVAQALYEDAIYDDDGNLLTSNMTTYLVPSATEFPRWELYRTETPSPTNPLGVKGVGETGAIASPAAVMNAVIDALAGDGITDINMPATPERVWRALEEVRS